MSTPPPSLGHRVRQILDDQLTARGLSLADLAARAGLPLVTLETLWADPGTIALPDFETLCLALELDPVEVWDLIGGPFGPRQ